MTIRSASEFILDKRMIKSARRKLLDHFHRAAWSAILALLALSSPSGIRAKDAKEPHGFDWAVSVESEFDLSLNQAATNDGDIELFILGQWYFSNRTKLYGRYGNEIDDTETFDAVGSYPSGNLNNVALEWSHAIPN